MEQCSPIILAPGSWRQEGRQVKSGEAEAGRSQQVQSQSQQVSSQPELHRNKQESLMLYNRVFFYGLRIIKLNKM